MKVLDPQAALLTVTELHDFLNSSQVRPKDRNIGAYKSVNTHNYVSVRRDVEAYLQNIAPHVQKQCPSDQQMASLLRNLKKYELTKTEIFSLINLGVGLHDSQPPVHTADGTARAESNGNTDETKHPQEETEETQQDADVEEPAESGLDRMLFGLAVEETDERFAGGEGEKLIGEILAILKDALIDSGNAATDSEVNGTTQRQ